MPFRPPESVQSAAQRHRRPSDLNVTDFGGTSVGLVDLHDNTSSVGMEDTEIFRMSLKALLAQLADEVTPINDGVDAIFGYLQLRLDLVMQKFARPHVQHMNELVETEVTACEE